MSVRAKVQCGSKTPNPHKEGSFVLTFHGVYEETGPNKVWSDATPALSLSIQIDNPAASAQFETGKTYFLDFSEAAK